MGQQQDISSLTGDEKMWRMGGRGGSGNQEVHNRNGEPARRLANTLDFEFCSKHIIRTTAYFYNMYKITYVRKFVSGCVCVCVWWYSWKPLSSLSLFLPATADFD